MQCSKCGNWLEPTEQYRNGDGAGDCYKCTQLPDDLMTQTQVVATYGVQVKALRRVPHMVVGSKRQHAKLFKRSEVEAVFGSLEASLAAAEARKQRAAASVEANKTARATRQAAALPALERAERAKKRIYAILFDIHGAPDGTPDSPDGWGNTEAFKTRHHHEAQLFIRKARTAYNKATNSAARIIETAAEKLEGLANELAGLQAKKKNNVSAADNIACHAQSKEACE